MRIIKNFLIIVAITTVMHWNLLRNKKWSFSILKIAVFNVLKWLFGRYCISRKSGANLTYLDRYTHYRYTHYRYTRYVLVFIIFAARVLLTQLEISNYNISSKCYSDFITVISIIIKINVSGEAPFRNLRFF